MYLFTKIKFIFFVLQIVAAAIRPTLFRNKNMFIEFQREKTGVSSKQNADVDIQYVNSSINTQ